jgi:hypothetical protein
MQQAGPRSGTAEGDDFAQLAAMPPRGHGPSQREEQDRGHGGPGHRADHDRFGVQPRHGKHDRQHCAEEQR